MASSINQGRSPSQGTPNRCHLCQEVKGQEEVLECGRFVCNPCFSMCHDSSRPPCHVGIASENQPNLRRLSKALLMKYDELFNTQSTYSRGNESLCCICLFRKKQVPATHQCLDCSDTLCETCSNGHNASSATHAHKVVPTNEDTSCIKAHKSLVRCSEHLNEMYVCFCETCKKLICGLCFIQQHITHDVEAMDAAQRYQRNMIKLKETITETISSTQLRELEERNKKTTRSKESLLNNIHSRCESFINFISAHKREATSRVLAFYDSHLHTIESFRDQTKEASDIAAQLIPLLDSIQKDPDPVRFLLLYEDVKTIVDHFYTFESQHDTAPEILKSELYLEVSNAGMTPPFIVKDTYLEVSGSKTIHPLNDKEGSNHASREKRRAFEKSDMAAILQHGDYSGEHNASLPLGSYIDDTRSVEEAHDHERLLGQGYAVTGTSRDNEKHSGFKLTESLTIKPFEHAPETGNQTLECSMIYPSQSQILPSPKRSELRPGDGVKPLTPYSSTFASVPLKYTGHRSLRQLPKLRCTSLPGDDAVVKVSNRKKQRVEGNRIASGATGGNTYRQIKFKNKQIVEVESSQDICTPEIRSLSVCEAGVVVSDNANKTVQLLNVDGKNQGKYSVDQSHHMPYHSVASLETHIVCVCGCNIVILNKKLELVKSIVLLDVSKITDTDCIHLPLAKYNKGSFIIGNLPDNKIRIYDTNGTMVSEQIAPVEGPIVALSLDNNEQLLYSSWHQPGAVYLIKKTGQLVKTFRPSGLCLWYPESTCVDKMNNVYIADPRPGWVRIFHPNGSHISTLTLTDSVITPRCLAMMSNEFLYVAGLNPRMIRYQTEVVSKA